MREKIKLSYDELSLMSMFQSVTGATAKDCIIDDKMDRIIFVINPGEMGLAIGKNGVVIKKAQNIIKKQIEVVEYSEDPQSFIKNILNPGNITDVRLTEKLDGTKSAVVLVDPKKKSVVVGQNGKNAEKARLLVKRYFEINTLQIVSN